MIKVKVDIYSISSWRNMDGYQFERAPEAEKATLPQAAGWLSDAAKK